MSTAINRMQFLHGDISGRNTPIRPPWSGAENTFIDICNSCGDCITQCPTKIISKGRGNYPVINFSAGECLFCGDCVDACKPKALSISKDQKPWSITASISSDECIAFKGVECRSCYDPCEAGSINMTPRLGGVSIPLLNATTCTGCGACISICPTKAVSMKIN